MLHMYTCGTYLDSSECFCFIINFVSSPLSTEITLILCYVQNDLLLSVLGVLHACPSIQFLIVWLRLMYRDRLLTKSRIDPQNHTWICISKISYLTEYQAATADEDCALAKLFLTLKLITFFKQSSQVKAPDQWPIWKLHAANISWIPSSFLNSIILVHDFTRETLMLIATTS